MKTRAQEDRAEDAPEDHPALVRGGDREVAEDQREDEQVVDREGLLDQKAGQVLLGRRAPLPRPEEPGETHTESVQPMLQATARRNEISSSRHPKAIRSTSSMATTNPANAPHIHTSSSMQRLLRQAGCRSTKVSPAAMRPTPPGP